MHARYLHKRLVHTHEISARAPGIYDESENLLTETPVPGAAKQGQIVSCRVGSPLTRRRYSRGGCRTDTPFDKHLQYGAIVGYTRYRKRELTWSALVQVSTL